MALKYGNGCEHYHDCFTCPFTRCKFDQVAGGRAVQSEVRSVHAKSLRRKGRTSAQIAQTLGISRRTVFRLLKV